MMTTARSRGKQPASALVVYTPGPYLRRPGSLAREMVRDLLASRELAWRLFVRNISARYRQTCLGYVWAFLPPVVGTAVFVYLRRSGFFSTDDPGVPYVVFLLTGLILWQTFADALTAPMRMITQSKSMLTRINFPREALILAGVAEVMFSFVIRATLLVPALIWFQVSPTASVLLVPAGLIVLVGLGLAIGIVLAPFASLYQDVEQALPILIPLWMFLTPVLYPPPAAWPGSLTMLANPVGPVLDTIRAWLLTGSPQYLAGFVWVGIGTSLLLILGWVLYRMALPILIERMSA